MYEVEIKVDHPHGPIRERLQELGAIEAGKIDQTDQYFDHVERSFERTDEALRLRRIEPLADDTDSTVELTYKGPRIGEAAKTRAEHTIAVDDLESATTILSELGFDPVARVHKRRERFKLEDTLICLDTVTGLGEWIEVEVTSESADNATAATVLESTLDRLGIDEETGLTTSYLELQLANT